MPPRMRAVCSPPARHFNFRLRLLRTASQISNSNLYWEAKDLAYRVPFVDPCEHYRRLKTEIDFAITDTLAKGDLVLRKQLSDFEQHLAEFVGVKYAVGVNSGYHALHFSLVAAGVGQGDEVITVGHTFVATVSAIVHTGATPVLVDVRKDYNLDPDEFERAITPRTKAVIPVHLNGRLCEMDRVMAIAAKHGLHVIEDAAQALGATFKGQRAGSFGLAGCFSFYPFKSLGGLGDGGAVTTNDPKVARLATLLRFNGEDRQTGEFHHHGYTALLDNVQAAVLDVKLRHLPSWIEHRRQTAALYDQGLRDIPDLALPNFSNADYYDSYQNYVIRGAQRDSLRQHLKDAGVETLVHWAKPMWEHAGLKLKNPTLPETESICREVISLPMSAETTKEQVEITVEAIHEFCASRQPSVLAETLVRSTA
jgi:dTDP-4-amino-4,6-dideoxygalactose transaminase